MFWLGGARFGAQGESKDSDLKGILAADGEDEVGSILNMRTVYDGVPPSPAELEREFRDLLTSMYETFSSESERLFDYEGFAASELNARLQNKVANSLQMFDISG